MTMSNTNKFLIFNIDKEQTKKLLLLFLAVVCLILTLSFSCNNFAIAEKKSSDFQEIFGENLDNLDLSELQKFLDGLDEEQRQAVNIQNLKIIIKQIADGKPADFFQTFVKIILKSIGTYFLSFLPLLLTIVIIAILKSILSGLTSNFKKKSTIEIVHFVCYCSVIMILFTTVLSVVNSVNKTITLVKGFSEIIFPILMTLVVGVGGVSSMSVLSPFMSIFSVGIIELVSKIVLPAFIAMVIFSIVGNISENVKLEKLTKFFSSGTSWFLGIIFGLFTTFLTTQGIVATSVDGLNFSAAKFALSSYVPILGGYLSEGFDLVAASLVILKNTLGLIAVIVLVAIVLFPLFKTIIFSLSLNLTGAILEPIGDKKISALLSSISKSLKVLIASVAGVGFMFFIILLLTVGTANYAL